ncbi:MAG: pyridoxamine 5'-phosphate oxidase family protein [Planctomycetota bacterium]
MQQSADECVLCWLATSSRDGEPNVSPKEIFAHFEGREIIIANIASPRTITNLRHNPRVCCSFVHIFTQKGFQLHGNGEVLHDDSPDYAARAAKLESMAGEAFPFDTIIRMTVDRVKPILAPRYVMYPETTEQQQIDAAMTSYGVRPI